MKRIHVFIYGLVKGVFFRSNIRKRAYSLDINGYVKNTDKGVEAVFEGKEDDIKKIIEFCKIGPKGARVDKLDIINEEYKNEFKEFKVMY
jgi:acylphosphatase